MLASSMTKITDIFISLAIQLAKHKQMTGKEHTVDSSFVNIS